MPKQMKFGHQVALSVLESDQKGFTSIRQNHLKPNKAGSGFCLGVKRAPETPTSDSAWFVKFGRNAKPNTVEAVLAQITPDHSWFTEPCSGPPRPDLHPAQLGTNEAGLVQP
jgi:hypothetical protein